MDGFTSNLLGRAKEMTGLGQQPTPEPVKTVANPKHNAKLRALFLNKNAKTTQPPKEPQTNETAPAAPRPNLTKPLPQPPVADEEEQQSQDDTLLRGAVLAELLHEIDQAIGVCRYAISGRGAMAVWGYEDTPVHTLSIICPASGKDAIKSWAVVSGGAGTFDASRPDRVVFAVRDIPRVVKIKYTNRFGDFDVVRGKSLPLDPGDTSYGAAYVRTNVLSLPGIVDNLAAAWADQVSQAQRNERAERAMEGDMFWLLDTIDALGFQGHGAGPLSPANVPSVMTGRFWGPFTTRHPGAVFRFAAAGLPYSGGRQEDVASPREGSSSRPQAAQAKVVAPRQNPAPAAAQPQKGRAASVAPKQYAAASAAQPRKGWTVREAPASPAMYTPAKIHDRDANPKKVVFNPTVRTNRLSEHELKREEDQKKCERRRRHRSKPEEEEEPEVSFEERRAAILATAKEGGKSYIDPNTTDLGPAGGLFAGIHRRSNVKK